MRDFNWATDLIDSACDNFVGNVSKSIDKSDNDFVVPDLVDELYHWSISGKLFISTSMVITYICNFI